MKNFLKFIFPVALIFSSCTNDGGGGTKIDTAHVTPPAPRVKGPDFSSDSAYNNIKTQVDFGPRVPGTKAHDACADYFVNKLKGYGLSVNVQTTQATLPLNQTMITIKNIVASYKPELKDRILLLAHWDTRPFADHDPDSSLVKKPFDGADDGGSGAAVLLEIARILQQKDPNIGVDLFFSDAEDGGLDRGAAETWCLGTQYWTQHMPKDYHARFGILLDMVGGRGAIFPREGTGVANASDVVEKVWSAAAALGYGNVFTNDITGETTDDHLFVNEYARIPTIDIVHFDPQTGTYPEWHHRHSDNMDIIDASSLKIVGTVLVDVIYNENPKILVAGK